MSEHFVNKLLLDFNEFLIFLITAFTSHFLASLTTVILCYNLSVKERRRLFFFGFFPIMK